MTKFLDLGGAAYLVDKIKSWVNLRIEEINAEGIPGPAGQITSATAEARPAGSQPTITLGGTPSQRTMVFGIPVGADGQPGQDGADSTVPGPAGQITSVTVVGLAAGADPTVELGGSASARTIQLGIPAGQPGQDGADSTVPGPAGEAPTVVEVPAVSWPPVDTPGVLFVKVP